MIVRECGSAVREKKKHTHTHAWRVSHSVLHSLQCWHPPPNAPPAAARIWSVLVDAEFLFLTSKKVGSCFELSHWSVRCMYDSALSRNSSFPLIRKINRSVCARKLDTHWILIVKAKCSLYIGTDWYAIPVRKYAVGEFFLSWKKKEKVTSLKSPRLYSSTCLSANSPHDWRCWCFLTATAAHHRPTPVTDVLLARVLSDNYALSFIGLPPSLESPKRLL